MRVNPYRQKRSTEIEISNPQNQKGAFGDFCAGIGRKIRAHQTTQKITVFTKKTKEKVLSIKKNIIQTPPTKNTVIEGTQKHFSEKKTFRHGQEFTITKRENISTALQGRFRKTKRASSQDLQRKRGKNHPGGKKNNSTVKKWLLRMAKAFCILMIIGCIFLVGVFIYFSKDLPEVGKVNSRFVAESTKIYDRTGEILLYNIHGEEKRTIIPSNQIPDTIRHATIALEDHDFYNHHGIKIKAILRAVRSQIFGIGVKSGGSTITQQLIKNSILTSERSITRKIKEAILAIELEFTASKEEILELYLNEIPYGSNAYGIQAAAKTFFNKDAKDLTYDEAAILASLPQAPSRYSPYGLNQEILKGRQERALTEMVDLGFITQKQSQDFKNVDVLKKIAKNREEINAPHFVFYIRDQLEEKYGAEYLEKNGLTIITTLDWEKQQIAEKIVQEKALANEVNYGAENASLVAIDPDTGEILTMVGSRNYFDEQIDGQVNVALAKRQPGSSFKPYVFLQSFVEGYTPETILYDVETEFPVDRAPDYIPQNYTGEFQGPVKIKDALAQSLNIPAVKALYLVGLDDTLNLVRNMGITTLNDPDRYGLSLVLGGGEVTLLDHTAAFGTLATGGIQHEKKGILMIRDRNGEELENNSKAQKGEQIIDPKYTSMISHILSTNDYRIPAFGERSALTFNDRSVAAKTGTTNENRDAWTMGYTPEIAVGVWGGNNDNRSMNDRGVGANVAAPIFRDFILEAFPDDSGKKFDAYNKDEHKTGKAILDGDLEEPDEIKVCEISKKDQKYCKTNKYCPEDREKKRSFFDAHNILHYINKEDPRGKEPKKPENDSFYNKWEDAVEDFYDDEDDIIFAPEPRECRSDDFKDQKPSISIEIENKGSEVKIKTKKDAPYKIEKFIYTVNGKEVARVGADNFTYKIPEEQRKTTLEIKVEVIDELKNTAKATKKFLVK